MTNLDIMVEELVMRTKGQKTERPITFDEYLYFIKSAIRRFYVDSGQDQQYNYEGFSLITSDDPDGFDHSSWFYDATFRADEREYILLCAEIGFYNMVQTEYNGIVSYTTNALSVANADKPYAYLGQTINDREDRRKWLFYKMARFGTVV